MYLFTMEQMTREQITAAAAAHRELGPDYEGALAEGLVERIGAEIDRRVDAKLAEKGKDRRRPAEVALTGRHRSLWRGVAIGSAATGMTAIIVSVLMSGGINSMLETPGQRGPVSYSVEGDMLIGLVTVWCLLFVIFLAHSWMRRDR
jgi:anti-sigma factor RsiW